MSTEVIKSTQEVAARFHELSQQGQFDKIQEELYADNCISIEPAHAPFKTVEGLEAIKQKGKEFGEAVEEMHGGYSKEPQVAGNHFSVAMGMDVTMKGQPRMNMEEIAVYEVKDGKIVKEQFFF